MRERYCVWCESAFLGDGSEDAPPLCEACRNKLVAKGKEQLVDLIGYIAGYNAVAMTYLRKIRDLSDDDRPDAEDFDPTGN